MENQCFWIRNEGELIGAFGGLLIAIVASYLTYWFTKYQSNTKDKIAYQGFVYALHVELALQSHQINLLKSSLYSFKLTSIARNSFALESLPSQFNISITETLLLKMLDYKGYNNNVVVLILTYLNLVRGVVTNLNFNNANALLTNLKTNQDIRECIDQYFKELNDEYVDKMQPLISDIRKKMEDIDLKDYPKEKLLLRENKY